MVMTHKRRSSFVYGGDGFGQKRRIGISGHYNYYCRLHRRCSLLDRNVYCWVRVVMSPAIGACEDKQHQGDKAEHGGEATIEIWGRRIPPEFVGIRHGFGLHLLL